MSVKVKVPCNVLGGRRNGSEYVISLIGVSLLIMLSYIFSAYLVPAIILAILIAAMTFVFLRKRGISSCAHLYEGIIDSGTASVFTLSGEKYAAFRVHSAYAGMVTQQEQMAELSRIESVLNSLSYDAYIALEPTMPETGNGEFQDVEKDALQNCIMFALFILVREKDAKAVENTLKSSGFTLGSPGKDQMDWLLHNAVRSEKRKNYYFSGQFYESSRSIEDFRKLDSEFWKFLTSLNLPFGFSISIHPENRETAARKLRRALAEHSAMMRLNAYRKGKASDIRVRKEDTEMIIGRIAEGRNIFTVSGDVRTYSSHPVFLKRLDAIISNYTALRNNGALSEPIPYSCSITGEHSSYMMDSLSLASIIHVPQKISLDGVMIGIDVDLGKPFFLDIFSGESYNMVILGQTGSGKSFFARILIKRLMISGKLSRAIILDPLGEYDPVQLSSGMGISSVVIDLDSLMEYHCGDTAEGKNTLYERRLPKISVIRTGTSVVMQQHTDLLASVIEEWMLRYRDECKAILVDEAHLFMVNPDGRKFLDRTVRRSRHFNTSVITISQNMEDFLRGSLNRSILSNSRHIFLFRSTISKKDIRDMFPEGADVPEISDLPGGKNSSFSECLYAGKELRHVRIISTEA